VLAAFSPNDHHVSMLFVVTTGLPPTPLIGASFLVLQFRLNTVAVTDLCGSASKFVFLSGFFEIMDPGPGWIP